MDQPPPRQPPPAHLSHILQHSPQRPPPPPPLPLALHHHSHRHQREPRTRTLPPTLRSDIIPPGLAGPSRYDHQTSPRVPPHATTFPPSLSLRPPPLEPYVKTNERGQVTKPKTWQGPDPRSLSKVMAIPVRHQQAEAPRVPLVKTTNMPDSVPPTHRQLATHETSATDDQTMHRKDSTDSQPSRTSNVSQSTSNSAEFASEGMSGAQDTRDRPKGDEPAGRRSAPDERSSQQAASEPAGQSQSPPRARRTRVLMTRMQWTALNRLWDQTIFPATAEREGLAAEIGLTPRQVQVWFQNQRQKRRRERETGDDGGADDGPADESTGPSSRSPPTMAEGPSSWRGGQGSASSSAWSMYSETGASASSAMRHRAETSPFDPRQQPPSYPYPPRSHHLGHPSSHSSSSSYPTLQPLAPVRSERTSPSPFAGGPPPLPHQYPPRLDTTRPSHTQQHRSPVEPLYDPYSQHPGRSPSSDQHFSSQNSRHPQHQPDRRATAPADWGAHRPMLGLSQPRPRSHSANVQSRPYPPGPYTTGGHGVLAPSGRMVNNPPALRSSRSPSPLLRQRFGGSGGAGSGGGQPSSSSSAGAAPRPRQHSPPRVHGSRSEAPDFDYGQRYAYDEARGSRHLWEMGRTSAVPPGGGPARITLSPPPLASVGPSGSTSSRTAGAGGVGGSVAGAPPRMSSLPRSLSVHMIDRPLNHTGEAPPPLSPPDLLSSRSSQDPSMVAAGDARPAAGPSSSPGFVGNSGRQGPPHGAPPPGTGAGRSSPSPTLPSLARLLN